MDFSIKRCKPCEGGIPALTASEINEFIKTLTSGWKVLENKIVKEFACVNYKHAIDYVNKVAALAEEEGHHPIMHVYYAKVVMELWTHSINGLSENDFILASKIDKL